MLLKIGPKIKGALPSHLNYAIRACPGISHFAVVVLFDPAYCFGQDISAVRGSGICILLLGEWHHGGLCSRHLLVF